MAIKTSNQITFTEQKKIKELKEWYLATNLEEGVTWETEDWTTNVQSVSSEKKYLWNYEEVIYSLGGSKRSTPTLIGMFGTGVNGKGITDVLHYYGVSQESELPSPIPDNFWQKEFSKIESLSSVNRYLWKYKKVLYTDGSSETTDPMIIGIYSDSGEDLITFQIYSLNGFEFIDSVNDEDRVETIRLQLSSFKGNQPLTGCLYTWYWWNPNPIIYTPIEVTSETVGEYWVLESETYVLKTLPNEYDSETMYYTEIVSTEGKYEEILTTPESFFDVNVNDKYALANLKCVISYNGEFYEDYITLGTKLDIYNASVKFFNGTNIFSQTEEYLVGYIDLYKNNKLEERVITDDCYIGASSIDYNTNLITTDYVGDNTLMYFVCSNVVYTEIEVTTETVGEYWVLENGIYVQKTLPEDDYNDEIQYYIANKKYEVVLGEYNGAEWYGIENSTKYIYQNDIDVNSNSNVFLISKGNISKARDVNIYVYTKYVENIEEDGSVTMIIDPSSMIATTHVVITDLNDVISGPTAPTNVYEGQLWLDTTNNMLKIYSNGEWINASKQQKGQNTYTIKPDSYEVGDLWIVSKEDEIIAFQKDDKEILNFTAGSIWIAIQKSDEAGFNAEHWSDAVPEITKLQNNIAYYFDFNKETGLKIGQSNERFYVNIKSTRMSFCENTDIEVSGEDIEDALDPHEVVYIGNKSATIRNLVVKESANINCAASIDNEVNIVNTYETKTESPGFTWQIEPDGGFSLVKMEVNQYGFKF